MSVTLEPPPAPRPQQSLALCAVVATAVVVGYVLFDGWWLRHALPAIFDDLGNLFTPEIWRFVAVVTPAALYAVVLAVWGIDSRHRVAGATCALAAGLVSWGLAEWLQHYMLERPVLSQSTLRAYDWAVTLVIPTLLALAWGLARRRGRVWVVGVAVAPLLAAVDHQLLLDSLWWQAWHFEHRDWWVLRVEFVAPVVVACVVSWLLEAATRRTPEMRSSA